MKRNTQDWLDIFHVCGVAKTDAAEWAPVFAEVIDESTFSLGDAELDDFLGQVLHESGLLSKLEEDLYYRTPGRLMATWPNRFPDLASERPYLRNPEALANKVYAGRMGNVNFGDGWRNRGSGLIQVTGANNLRAVQAKTGIPVYDNPDLLRRPSAEALRVCIAWWEGNVPDAVMGDTVKVTKAVNGGQIGYLHRKELTGKAEGALDV